MNTEYDCFLCNEENPTDRIILPHAEEVMLGRNRQTKIMDKRCSRKQVCLLADAISKKVKVWQIGENSSGVNGMALKKDEIYILKAGDRLEVLLGKHIYKIEFCLKAVNGDFANKIGMKRVLHNEGQAVKRMCSEGSSLIHSGDAKPCQESKWEHFDNDKLIVFTSKDVTSKKKIAAFDIDGTIIVTQSGRVFPKDDNDWKIAFSEVPGKLKQLWKTGYKIVFFSNQAGISKGKLKIDSLKTKICKIVSKLGIPVQVFISTGKGIYRKPAPGMWNVLLEKKNDDIKVEMESSFYCGDAAGRVINWAPKKKKDFSCSDRLFALNLGLKFYTPEEYFLGYREALYKLPEFIPSDIDNKKPLCEPEDTVLHSSKQEVIVLVGSPGSGKSYFACEYLVSHGYVHINRDTLGSWQRCVTALETALQKGQNAVVDNTNPEKDSRKRFVDIAIQRGIPCRCFVIATSAEHAKHNNKFRELTDDSHEPVSEVIINMYRTKYEEPSTAEGFTSVVKINFIPKFKNPEQEKLYKMYLLEK